jgi:hypothetical protein
LNSFEIDFRWVGGLTLNLFLNGWVEEFHTKKLKFIAKFYSRKRNLPSNISFSRKEIPKVKYFISQTGNFSSSSAWLCATPFCYFSTSRFCGSNVLGIMKATFRLSFLMKFSIEAREGNFYFRVFLKTLI